MIGSDDIGLVERTLALVLDDQQTLAHTYLDRLFEVRPEMRSHFKADRAVLVARFMAIVHSAPLAAEAPDEMLEALREMGAEHAAWGVQEEHYADMGAAILWAFEVCAGPSWDAAMAEAWRRLLASVGAELRAGWRQETDRRVAATR